MQKKLLLSFLVVTLLMPNLIAQSIELTPFYGYTLNGKIKTYYGDYNVADAPSYGVLLSVELGGGSFLELMYNRNDTKFTYNRVGYSRATIGLATEYYHIGIEKQVEVNEKVHPFGAFTLGATRFHPKDSHDWNGSGVTSLSDAWRFSTTFGGGVKIYLSERIGLRLQARLLLPMEFNGMFIGIGSGGSSAGASFRVPIVSGDFTAGLILRLGE